MPVEFFKPTTTCGPTSQKTAHWFLTSKSMEFIGDAIVECLRPIPRPLIRHCGCSQHVLCCRLALSQANDGAWVLFHLCVDVPLHTSLPLLGSLTPIAEENAAVSCCRAIVPMCASRTSEVWLSIFCGHWARLSSPSRWSRLSLVRASTPFRVRCLAVTRNT